MTEPSLQLGNGNWAGKSGNLLAYHKANNNFYADELTFTRASTGTRVNADGLIEEVPYNLLQYSEQFDNAAWLKVGGAVTANAGVSPNGQTTADRFYIASAASNTRLYALYTFAAQEYTLSVYAKNNGSTDSFRFSYYDGVSQEFSSDFSLTNEWQRFTHTFTAATGAGAGVVWIANTSSTGVGSELDLLIWGAQLNSGSTAKTYSPTTDRLNVPRIDYTNGCGKLLLEPQRTNFITQSSNLSLLSKVAVGTASPPVTTANYATSPDGTQNATRVVFDLNGGSGRSILRQAIPLGSDYYFSIYVKSTNGADQKVMFHDGDEQNTYTVTNEWQRITYDGRSGISYAGIALTGDSGADTSDILVWGFQVEQGSYATSYIPTSGATVTRLADTCVTTGLSDVINDSEGVLFAEIAALSNDNTVRMIQISNGTNGNRVIIYYKVGGTINGALASGGSTVVDIPFSATFTNTHKVAVRYKLNNVSLWVNGAKVGENLSANPPIGLDRLSFNQDGGANYFYGNVKNLQIFKTALTDTELATLTTL